MITHVVLFVWVSQALSLLRAAHRKDALGAVSEAIDQLKMRRFGKRGWSWDELRWLDGHSLRKIRGIRMEATAFEIDLKLAQTSYPLVSLDVSDLRLVDDQRWPRLLIIPRVPHAVELIDLSPDLRSTVWLEIDHCTGDADQLSPYKLFNAAPVISSTSSISTVLHGSLTMSVA